MAALPLTKKRNRSDRTTNGDKTWLSFSVIYKVRQFVRGYRKSIVGDWEFVWVIVVEIDTWFSR